jgi:hypothetical protein
LSPRGKSGGGQKGEPQDRVHAAAPVHDGGRPLAASIPGSAVRSTSGVEELEWL